MMSQQQLQTTIQRLYQNVEVTCTEQSDADLLHRFVTQGDERAKDQTPG